MPGANMSDLWREAAELQAILNEMKARGERVPIAIEEKAYIIESMAKELKARADALH